MRGQSVIITRSQVGQWGSYIGATALLIGLLGVIWQGGITLAVGVALGIGALGILLWALATPAEFRAFIGGRQTRYGTMAFFGSLVLIGVVVLVYILLQRAVITLDMTTDQRFTITDATRTILHQISKPIRITGFYSSQLLQQRDVDDQFFREYEVESNGMVTRNYVDPDQQPAIAQKFGLQYDGEVFISFLNSDGSVDFSSVQAVPRGNSQEEDMTQAIQRLLISGTIKVYFEQSHGELNPTDGSQQGLSGINNGIQESGLITAPLMLTELAQAGGDVPADASAIILVRPTTDFNAAEIAVVDRYLKRGGSLFIMGDVLYNDNAFLQQNSAFNQYLWTNYGVQALDAVVVDPASSSQTALDVVTSAVYPDNEIAKRLNQQNTPPVFNLVRALQINSSPPGNVTNGAVALSSQQSYGETDLKALGETNTFAYDAGQDIPGPFPMVAWANNQQTGAKIVLVGDSDFVTNSQVTTGGNSILFTDALSWLSGFGQQINYGVKAFRTTPLVFVSGQNLDVIAFLTVIVLPGLVLAVGFIVWSRRMRA